MINFLFKIAKSKNDFSEKLIASQTSTAATELSGGCLKSLQHHYAFGEQLHLSTKVEEYVWAWFFGRPKCESM